MSGFLRRQLDHILHRSRSRSHSRDRESSQPTTTTATPHHIVEFVKSADGLTYIAPPYMVGVPVAQWDPKTTSTTASTVSPPSNPIPLEPSRLFANPVLTGLSAEPSIVRVGEEFFLTTASGVCFPGLPIYRSADLVNWKLVGHALGRKSQWMFGEMVGEKEEKEKSEGDKNGTPVKGIQMPCLREIDGIFYLVACWWEGGIESSQRAFYIQSSNILDDAFWSDPIFLDGQGLAQDVSSFSTSYSHMLTSEPFCNNDEKAYLTSTSNSNQLPINTVDHTAVFTSEADLATGKSVTKVTVSNSNHSTLPGVSRIVKRGKFYYLFTTKVSSSVLRQGCVSRSEQGPSPPWDLAPKKPLWCDGFDEEVQNISHTDIFVDSDGKWWAIFSGTRPTKVDGKWIDSVLGPETFLVMVDWEDDWPIFNGGKSISQVTTSHSDKLKTKIPYTWSSDFSKPELEIGWYQLYPFTPSPLYTLLPSKRNLRIHGNAHDLSSPEPAAFLLRKQSAFREAWKVLLTFKPSARGSEAGIVVWVNRFAYCALGVHLAEDGGDEGKAGARVVSLTSPNGEGGMDKKVVQKLPKYDCVVGLDVEAKDDGYYFSVSTQKDYDYVVSSVSCEALMKGVAAAPSSSSVSTGAMFGLYAFTNEESCSDVADFGNVLVVNTDRS